jgi:hypothetical protein
MPSGLEAIAVLLFILVFNMFIHQSICISPQHTFQQTLSETFVSSVDNKLQVIEPKYEDIPLNVMRRMGKAVRMGVGACLPIIKQHSVDGVIIGTANGGMDDCIKFLNQVIEFDEGTLTPTNFVQSTSNAIAAQVAFLSQNNQYNITHVHRGLASKMHYWTHGCSCMKNQKVIYW